MSSPFMSLRYNIADKTEDEKASLEERPTALRGMAPGGAQPKAFESDESAARFYCGKVFAQDARPRVRGLSAPDAPAQVPDLKLQNIQKIPQTGTKLVRFEQIQSDVPVFGTAVSVELGRDQGLVSIAAELADIRQVSPLASISASGALASIAQLASVAPDSLPVDAPQLTYFHDDETDDWHLAWLFRKVPAVPTGPAEANPRGHGMGRSPRDLNPLMNYLVDAHDGKVLFFYNASPTITKCSGRDELGTAQSFLGALRQVGPENLFEMVDDLRSIKTYDLEGKDMDQSAFPVDPCRCPKSNWDVSNTAAVSAHVNAQRVYDFYKSVLMRDSVDGKGMNLVSVVHCIYQSDEPGPEWHNAVWYNNRMWYGQAADPGGKLRSYSRFLDVIAHELTHGVTEHTADLVYKNESGALNESFSDIFGIVIANWDPRGTNQNTSGWKWELGTGLGDDGLPLRDMSDPSRTGDPDHMNGYLHTTRDSGGVHTNSNIHNKAAYNVFTSKDGTGKAQFQPLDVALFYYIALQRLGALGTFKQTLEALVDAAKTYYAGDTADRDAKVAAIRAAYGSVGIS